MTCMTLVRFALGCREIRSTCGTPHPPPGQAKSQSVARLGHTNLWQAWEHPDACRTAFAESSSIIALAHLSCAFLDPFCISRAFWVMTPFFQGCGDSRLALSQCWALLGQGIGSCSASPLRSGCAWAKWMAWTTARTSAARLRPNFHFCLESRMTGGKNKLR